MGYKALYRKWRPILFDDVIGQAHITNTLKNEILDNISKSYGLVSVPFSFYSIRNMFLSKHVSLFSNILLSLRLSF